MKKIYAIGLAAALCGAVSCSDDFLDQKPIGAYGESTLASKVGINATLIGAYALVNGTGGMTNSPGQLLFGSIRGGEAHKGSAAGDQQQMLGVQAFEVTTSTGHVNTPFVRYYNGIYRANSVLALIPQVTELTPAEAIQIEAQARFLRAHWHFEARRLFKNIPFIDETVIDFRVPNTDDAGNYVDVWPQIIADMDFARQNLPVVQPDWGRPNKWAAEAYYAKMRLYMGNEGVAGAYADALTVFTDFINNGRNNANNPFSLIANFSDLYDPTRENDNNREWIWGAQHSVNDGTPGTRGPNGMPEFPYIGTQTGGANSPGFGRGYGFFAPSRWFVDHYRVDANGLPIINNAARVAQALNNDEIMGTSYVPDPGLIDPRLDWKVGRQDIPYKDFGLMPGASWCRDPVSSGTLMAKEYYIWKNQKDTYDINGRANAINVPVIRYADVLLMAAELEARVGSLTTAQTYVNMIRNRMKANSTNLRHWLHAYSSGTTYSTTDLAANYKVEPYTAAWTTKGEALRAILYERTLELGLEGHRAYDLIRFGTSPDVTTDWDVEEFTAYIAYESALGRVYLAGATFDKDKDRLMPFPQSAVDNSFKGSGPTLKQNPGY